MDKVIKNRIIFYLKELKKSKKYASRILNNAIGLEEEETQNEFDSLTDEIRELGKIVNYLENDLQAS